MTSERDVSAGLPPKPDPQTGEPRPPRGVLEPNWKRAETKHKRGRSKVAEPPAGEGPVLEWFYPSRGSSMTVGALMSVVMIGYFTWRDWGLGWITTWWLWLFVLPWPFIFLLAGRNIRISAGADWVIYGKNGTPPVKTYELTKIDVTVGGASHYLALEDKHGNAMTVQIGSLQHNRELWDLLYLGLLYSVHEGGAETNKRADDYLGLKVPPELRQWEPRES